MIADILNCPDQIAAGIGIAGPVAEVVESATSRASMKSVIASVIESGLGNGLSPEQISVAVLGRLRHPTSAMVQAIADCMEVAGGSKYQTARAVWKAALAAAYWEGRE